MPTNRNESYRFTDVAPIMAQSFEVTHEPQPVFISDDAHRPVSIMSKCLTTLCVLSSNMTKGIQLWQCMPHPSE